MLIPHLLTVIWLGRLSESLFGPAGAWFNNWPSLTIPFFASVFNIFLLRQFFLQIPNDLWDAARIDGAGHFKFLRSGRHAPVQSADYDHRDPGFHRLLERADVAPAGDHQ